PLAAPCTMPLMSARAKPWKREPSRPPIVGRTFTAVPSTVTFTFGGSLRESWPFAPFTSSVSPLSVAVTPLGSSTGRLPTRDCLRSEVVVVVCVVMASPDGAEELAAHALLARVAVGHHAARRREDRDPHARTNARNAIVTDVDAAARRRQTEEPVDRRLLVVVPTLLVVAEHDREGLA